MDKKEYKKQLQKIQDKNALKWIKYAKNMCVFIVVVFLFYVFLFSQILKEGFSDVIVKYPIIGVGFVIAAANIFIWYVLKQIIHKLEELKGIEFAQLMMIIIVIAQVFLMNFVSVILLVIGLRKHFSWKQFQLKQTIVEIKREKKILLVIGISAILVLFIVLAFTISIASNHA